MPNLGPRSAKMTKRLQIREILFKFIKINNSKMGCGLILKNGGS